MENKSEQLLEEIRNIMRDSSRVRLNGLAFLMCGAVGVAGYVAAMFAPQAVLPELCCAVFVLGVAVFFIFSLLAARRGGRPLRFSALNRMLFVSLALPVFCGGIVCVSMYLAGVYEWIPAMMLLFFGLGVVACSRNSESSSRFLGFAFLALGLAACFFREMGALLWVAGFGGALIAYGLYLIVKSCVK